MTTKIKLTQVYPVPASASNSELTGTPTAPTPSTNDDSTKIATTAYVKDNLDNYSTSTEIANNYLALSGGDLTGNFYGKPFVDPDDENIMFICKDPLIAKGTLPETNHWFTLGMATDNTGSPTNSHKFGQIETAVYTTGKVETSLGAFKNVASDTAQYRIGVGWDPSTSSAYTIAPTPVTTDNSTKIATTAYVKSNLSSYLPLTGGTISGTLTIGTSGCTLSYNATNKCLDFIFS